MTTHYNYQRLGRSAWIDVYKAIGIISVVAGHFYDECRFVFLFHMPMFFLLAGYTVNDEPMTFAYMKRKTTRLIIPYVSYFLLLMFLMFLLNGLSISSMYAYVKSFIYGGERLNVWFGVFWFIPVYYISILFFNLIKEKISWLLVGVMLLLAYLLSPFKEVFNNIQVVPMAMTYMAIGYYLKPNIMRKFWFSKLTIPLCCGLLFVTPFLSQSLYIDMKHADYGIPIISFVVSILCSISIMVISKSICRLTCNHIYVLSGIGGGSMTIMYMHQMLHYSLSGILPLSISFLTAIILPLAVNLLIRRNKILSMIF